MRNLLLMTFATMGLLFTSCGEFHPRDNSTVIAKANLANDAIAESGSRYLLDYFNCEFQFVDEADQLLYSHSETVCAERMPSESPCFFGDKCTHANLAINHKVSYGDDEISYFANFSYDHFIDSVKAKAMLYVCDESTLTITNNKDSRRDVASEKNQDECLQPQLGTYNVKIEDQIPSFIPQVFQGHFKLDSGEIFQVFCEHQKTEIGESCQN